MQNAYKVNQLFELLFILGIQIPCSKELVFVLAQKQVESQLSVKDFL